MRAMTYGEQMERCGDGLPEVEWLEEGLTDEEIMTTSDTKPILTIEDSSLLFEALDEWETSPSSTALGAFPRSKGRVNMTTNCPNSTRPTSQHHKETVNVGRDEGKAPA